MVLGGRHCNLQGCGLPGFESSHIHSHRKTLQDPQVSQRHLSPADVPVTRGQHMSPHSPARSSRLDIMNSHSVWVSFSKCSSQISLLVIDCILVLKDIPPSFNPTTHPMIQALTSTSWRLSINVNTGYFFKRDGVNFSATDFPKENSWECAWTAWLPLHPCQDTHFYVVFKQVSLMCERLSDMEL